MPARGSAASIARTQLSSTHYNQRPDHEVAYDSTRSELSGSVSSLSLRRFAGRARWETTTHYAEPGTELTIDLDQCSLELPVVGGAEAWARAVQE